MKFKATPAFFGSPPRMRERLFLTNSCGVFDRITPAYAGKTLQIALCAFHIRDHPRVCGKDRIKLKLRSCLEGSPPRMRERLIIPIMQTGKLRITPAYAGKTALFDVIGYSHQDHPRVCGKDLRRGK